MGRRHLWRRVSFVPPVTYFKPSGLPMTELQEVRLLVEEAEAIRLKDFEGLEQEEGARKMNVSRSTFSRVLDSARQKIADALLNGKAIRIEGGSFEMAERHFRCISGHEWKVPFETMISTPPKNCPECDTPSIMPIYPPDLGRGTRGQNMRHRGGSPRPGK